MAARRQNGGSRPTGAAAVKPRLESAGYSMWFSIFQGSLTIG